MLEQRTVKEKIACQGIGLHSGQNVTLQILPAAEDNGITFFRTDMLRHAELRACIDHVSDTTLATTLQNGLNGSRATVGTVEHLLAALMGMGIDNARIAVDGPEVPIMDGSAFPFVRLIQKAGIELQRKSKRFLVIRREVKIQDGDKIAKAMPGSGFSIRCTLDYDHPLIPATPFEFYYSERMFQRDLAKARTFGFLKDVKAMQARGLAQGGSLDNAVVIDDYQVLNPEGLRFPDEFIRHKVLDALGDLALLGLPVVGKIRLHRSGHAMNTELVRQVLSDSRNYAVVTPATAPAEFGILRLPADRPAVLEPANSMA